MEHISVLNKIIEADKNARARADEAGAKREHLDEDLAREREWLRKELMDAARKRAATALANEKERSDNLLADLDDQRRREFSEIDHRLSSRREELAAKIFALVVGDAD